MKDLATIIQRFGKARQTSRIGPIGLHFSDAELHAVQLARSARGALYLRAWASTRYPVSREQTFTRPDQLKQLLHDVLGRGRFKGRRAVTALPPEQLKITSLKYSADPKLPDAQRIYQLMAERVEGNVEDYILDYLPVRSQSSDTDRVALVATCARAEALTFLEALRGTGIDVEYLEIGPVALNRLVNNLPDHGQSRQIMIINFGADYSYLTILSGRRLLLDQQVKFGEGPLISRVAKTLDLTEELAKQLVLRQGLDSGVLDQSLSDHASTSIDANVVTEIVEPLFTRLVDEIKRACRYASSESQGAGIDQVYAFGSVARWPGVDQLLSRLASIPAADILPLAAMFESGDGRPVEHYRGIGPDLAVATGHALRGMTPDA